MCLFVVVLRRGEGILEGTERNEKKKKDYLHYLPCLFSDSECATLKYHRNWRFSLIYYNPLLCEIEEMRTFDRTELFYMLNKGRQRKDERWRAVIDVCAGDQLICVDESLIS